MKLHLGAGKHRWDGWINVDVPDSGADVECDVHELPWPDNVADEITSIHLIEHIPMLNVGLVLREWVRVLKPGGVLTIETPCRDKVFDFIRKGVTDPYLVLNPLWGDPRTHRTTADVHRWCWSKSELAMLMRDAGLVDLQSQEPKFHIPMRDMRLVGVKGGD
jgi:predicted SAM-dependent methyltransferase